MVDASVRIIHLTNWLIILVFKTSMEARESPTAANYRVKFLYFLLSCLIYIEMSIRRSDNNKTLRNLLTLIIILAVFYLYLEKIEVCPSTFSKNQIGHFEAGKMVQQVKIPAARPENLWFTQSGRRELTPNSFPRTFKHGYGTHHPCTEKTQIKMELRNL